MAAKKPPKPKSVEVPSFDVEVDYGPSVEDYEDYYPQKPVGSVDIGGSTRSEALKSLDDQYSGYLDTRSKLIDEYYADNDTNWGDVLAEALLTVGPIIAGYALDKKQGGIYGSQIGLNAGANYRQNVEREEEIKRYRTGKQLQNVEAQISQADKLRQQWLDDEWKNQDARQLRADDREFEETRYQNRRGDRLEDLGAQLQMRSQYASGGGQKQSAPFQPSDAYIEELAQRSGKTVEEIRAALPKTNADAYAQVQFGDFMGNRPKAVGQEAKDQVGAGMQAKYLLSEMRKDAALMAQDPGVVNALKGGRLIEAYRVPGSPAERFYRNALQLQKQIVKQNDGNRPTDKDNELMTPVVQGSPTLDTPESLLARIGDLEAYSDFKLQNVLAIESATGRKTDKLQEMINGIGAIPSDTSGNSWLDRVEQGQVPVSSNVPIQKPSLAQFNGNVEAYKQALRAFIAQGRK